MITVYYSNGHEAEFNTAKEARDDIVDVVIGSDFDITLDSVDSDDDHEYSFNWEACELEEVE